MYGRSCDRQISLNLYDYLQLIASIYFRRRWKYDFEHPQPTKIFDIIDESRGSIHNIIGLNVTTYLTKNILGTNTVFTDKIPTK